MVSSRQRLAPRYEVGDRFGRLGWQLHADMVNISLGGMAVRLQTPLAPETKLRVAIRRPGEELNLDGAAQWCRSVENGRGDATAPERSYEVGIEFSGALDTRSDAIMEFISSTPTLSVQRGTFGRFVLDYDEPIRLQAACPFRLRLLSLSGMLVESRAAPHRDCEVQLSIPFEGEDFLARGRVVNVADGMEGDLPYRIGIGFNGLTAAQLPVLQAFVENIRNRLDS
jgi:hypothetical protein